MDELGLPEKLTPLQAMELSNYVNQTKYRFITYDPLCSWCMHMEEPIVKDFDFQKCLDDGFTADVVKRMKERHKSGVSYWGRHWDSKHVLCVNQGPSGMYTESPLCCWRIDKPVKWDKVYWMIEAGSK